MARDKQRKQKRRARALLVFAAALLGLVVIAAGTLGVAFLVVAYDPDLPRIQRLGDYDPPRATKIYFADGALLGEIFRERRTVVAMERIPRLLVQAVVAAEDAQFYRHAGLDYAGMLRAFFANLRAGRFAQGGSTITQQVVKTFFLSPERTLRRKMQEVILARRLERALAKDEILHLYLNQIYLGHGRYGFEEAARFYFGHSIEKLSLAEAALLAGLPQAPEALTPLRHPDRAKRRQVYVLEQMEKLGAVDAASARAAREAALPLARTPSLTASPVQAPEIVDWVQALLAERYGADRVPYLGARVRTSIDAAMQSQARAALEQGLRALDERQGYRKPLRHLEGKAIAKQLERLRQSRGPTVEALVIEVDTKSRTARLDLGTRQATLDLTAEPRFAAGKSGENPPLRSGDVLRVRAAPERGKDAVALDMGPQGALVAIEPSTGQVRALVGGYGFHAGGFDRARQARRQPGSAFKPITYAAAIESGRFTAATVLVDSPEVFASWKPRNYDATSFRGPLRLRVALADSVNTIAVKLLGEVGVEATIATARRLGIASPLDRNLSLALGASAVTPLELASAFGTFAAGGRRTEPSFVVEIDGRLEPASAKRSAISAQAAYVMVDLLRSVIEDGTGRAARRVARPAAGKTGTSDDHKDAWFVGFTPDLCAAVWIGFDEPRPLGKGEAGGRAAVPIWTDFMLGAHAGRPARAFRQPAGIVSVRIDPATGLRAPPEMAEAIDEIFVSGTEPVEVAPSAGEIDAETFLLEQMKPGGQ